MNVALIKDKTLHNPSNNLRSQRQLVNNQRPELSISEFQTRLNTIKYRLLHRLGTDISQLMGYNKFYPIGEISEQIKVRKANYQ